jgi:hypothetical protein
MSNPEDPPGFVVRTEAQKAAFERGFRIERGIEGPWIHYASTTAPPESGSPAEGRPDRGSSRWTTEASPPNSAPASRFPAQG